MKIRVLVVVVAIGGVACSHASPHAQGPAPVVQAFDRSSLDTTCAPCRDFFQFANGEWLKHTEIPGAFPSWGRPRGSRCVSTDRKSTRLNSSHSSISYAVFCLKKKKKKKK